MLVSIGCVELILSQSTASKLRRDFRKLNNLNMFQFCLTCLLFNLFIVKITVGYETQAKWHHFVNKFFLITNFTKTCIKALYMHHNNWLTRKLSHISTQPHQLRTYNAVCICTSIFVYVHTAETAAEAVWVVPQTQLNHVCVWP